MKKCKFVSLILAAATLFSLSACGGKKESGPKGEITVDGAATGIKTDAEGKATIQISSSGKHLISAVSSSETLVPPVCTAQLSGGLFASIISAVISLISTVINFFLSLIK